MNPIEFSQRLLQAEPGSPESAALARDLIEDARYPGHFVVQNYLSSREISEQQKAKSVLADLHELSLLPMAEIASAPDVQTDLWIMRTMIEELVAFRSRTVSVLKRLLTNLRPVRESLPPDQFHLGTRACDLAFILLHRILHMEAPPAAFLGLPRDTRDKRIKEFQESRAFRSIGPS
jgi:hypothetical protein